MIIRNAARCSVCDDFIESKHVHDFVWCKCGAIAVDGGREYLRRVGNLDKFVECSEFRDENGENSIKLLIHHNGE